MQQSFVPTREAALGRLAAFLPGAGEAYAADRNHDHGPDRRGNVSLLSPFIRHRLITEREVCAAALERHAFQAAEKFIQEVLWRTYWKGWLELRPGVWRRYLHDLDRTRETTAANGGLRRDLRAAVEGRTGIEGFDDWARELVETGYLHNHARMWFASIWIFTLRLPWQLGADFFLRHLLDGDPASNTLSWRWVAGLQTRGKTYAASRDNIAKFTGGRFSPKGLATAITPLDEPPPEPPAALTPMAARFDGEAALLLTDDDYGIETLPVDWSRIGAAAVSDLSADRAADGVSDDVAAFVEGAAENTLGRLRGCAPHAAVTPRPLVRITPDDIAAWLESVRMTTLVIPETPVGPGADAIAVLVTGRGKRGIAVARLRRSWDAAAWPRATAGFFPFKAAIPDILEA
ncbi:MAG: FAD-binding domain-containing protein, partial [Beijerinckiaceae bacterium]